MENLYQATSASKIRCTVCFQSDVFFLCHILAALPHLYLHCHHPSPLRARTLLTHFSELEICPSNPQKKTPNPHKASIDSPLSELPISVPTENDVSEHRKLHLVTPKRAEPTVESVQFEVLCSSFPQHTLFRLPLECLFQTASRR
jgi:hypothetical protein